MNIISKSQAQEIIKATKGKFFSVVFTKKDKSLRKMNARLGVKKHLHGGRSTTDHLNHLITVCDMQAHDYRNINLDTLQQITFQHKTYAVE